jgi:hypothetical protein
MPEKTAEPKYTPRTAAAEFVKGLPSLGVEESAETKTSEETVVAEPKTEKVETATTAVAAEVKTEEKVAPVTTQSTEVKIPRTSKDWDAYKAAEKIRLEAKDAEISKIREEMEALRKAPPVSTVSDDDPRIVSTKKERDELSERLRLVDITNHPKFKAHYEGRVNAQIDMAKKIVGSDNSEAIATLLKLPDNEYRQSKIEELVSTLSPIQQSRVAGVLNSLNEIEIERDGQIEQAKKDYVKYQEDAKLAAEAKQKENMTKAETAFNTVLSTLQNPKDKDGLFIFQKQEGNEEWNKGVDERTKYAKEMLFGKHDPQVLIKAAFHAAALPGVVKSYQILLSQVKGLEDQVKGMTASQPKMEKRETREGGEKTTTTTTTARGKGKFLGGRQMSADWVKSLNETQQTE